MSAVITPGALFTPEAKDLAPGTLLSTIEQFDTLLFEPLIAYAAACEAAGLPCFVGLDTETTRIDPKKGFNPFYGTRVSMGSISYDGPRGKENFAWTERMRPGLRALPSLRAEKDATRRNALREAITRWHGVKDVAGTFDLAEFPEWCELDVEWVDNIDPELIVDRLDALTAAGVIWVFKNAKFDLLMLWADGFVIPNDAQVEDVEVQSHLTEDKPWVKGKKVGHKLQDLATRHLGRAPEGSDAMDAWFKAMGTRRDDRDYACVPVSIEAPYAWQDTRDTIDLFHFFLAKMQRMDAEDPAGRSMCALYKDEVGLIYDLVYETIVPGLPIDQDAADAAYAKYSGEKAEHDKRLYELTGGKVIDWVNSEQVASHLFDQPAEGGLGLEVPAFGWTRDNKRSTDKSVLKSLSTPLTEAILDYREAHYFAENFIGPLARFNYDGFIHPDFWITTARTGRMSASHPNMQNRPKDPDIRRIFVPRPGYVMLPMDLDQIEMRIAAHYAKKVMEACEDFWYQSEWQGKRSWRKSRCTECNLWDGFSNDPDFDPHQIFADKSGLPRKTAVSGEMDAKNGNFLIMYGGGINKMAQNFGWELSKARGIKRDWRKAYPEMVHLMNFIAMRIVEQGYVASEYGRRYYIDLDKAYLGLNYLVQGTAADLIKRGLRKLYALMRELREATEGPQPIYLDNVVHDEIVPEVREDLLTPELARRINDCITTHLKVDGTPMFNLPITAGCEVARENWAETAEFALAPTE